jgi:hypothetical protein
MCQSHVAGLMARLRDGQLTTRFGLVFAVKVLSEPAQTGISANHLHGFERFNLQNSERWRVYLSATHSTRMKGS